MSQHELLISKHQKLVSKHSMLMMMIQKQSLNLIPANHQEDQRKSLHLMPNYLAGAHLSSFVNGTDGLPVIGKLYVKPELNLAEG